MKRDRLDLSICIPTFNRARYLDCLFQDFAEKQAAFCFSYELIVSDNASQDETQKVINRWESTLPIIFLQQNENVGPALNIKNAFYHARGAMTMYLGSDDFISVDGLNESIKELLESPNTIALYAPWYVADRDSKDDPLQKSSFELGHDYLFPRGDHASLLNLVLAQQIFPEIFIFRTSALKLMNFKIENTIAFWAFVLVSDFLSHGDVLFAKRPFYTCIIHYFKDEGRITEGGREVKTAWDFYRGGLEYMTAKVADRLDEQNAFVVSQLINAFVTNRMIAAIDNRIKTNDNPVDVYFLASRLVGLGQKKYLPLSFNEIRTRAAIWYLGNDANLTKGMDRILLVGKMDEMLVDLVRAYANLPVECTLELDRNVNNSICLVSELKFSEQVINDFEEAGNVIFVQNQLMRMFP